MTPTKFVKTCKDLFGETGWQGRLAEELQVDGSSVRRWVSGAVPVPGPVVAYVKLKAKYADLLDKSGKQA